MNSEQLREIVVRAAIPLVEQYDTLTTAQIAEAAGIDDADLLAVFADTNAVVRACLGTVQAYLGEAFDPTDVLRELQTIPLDHPLTARLVDAVGALDRYHARMVAHLAPLEAGGAQPSRREGATVEALHILDFDERGLRGAARIDVIQHAVTELLEPDQERLRLPADILAGALLGMYSARGSAPGREQTRLSADELTDLFLHGASTSAPSDRARTEHGDQPDE
jgi:hypothetical protein